MLFDGKVIIITGGAGGIGRATAAAFAKEGGSVVIADLKAEAAEDAAKAIRDAGGHVQLGAHGQLQGLGAHWELWMLAQGGMTPLEALACGTIDGARYLGLDHDIGSLEKGKLADLVVLDRNPLEDIKNSDSVRWVMVNGRLYDAATMNEVGNHPRQRLPFWWEQQP